MNSKIKKQIQENSSYKHLKESFEKTLTNIEDKECKDINRTYPFNYGFLKSAVTLFIEEVENKSKKN